MSSSDIAVNARVSIKVIESEHLGRDFKIRSGLQCHLKFANNSHPAVILVHDQNGLAQGETADVDVLFTALEHERDQIVPGLQLQFVGGVDKLFAEGIIVAIHNIQ